MGDDDALRLMMNAAPRELRAGAGEIAAAGSPVPVLHEYEKTNPHARNRPRDLIGHHSKNKKEGRKTQKRHIPRATTLVPRIRWIAGSLVMAGSTWA